MSQNVSWLLHPIKAFCVFPHYSLLMSIIYSSENWLSNILFFFTSLLRLNFTPDFLWTIYSLMQESFNFRTISRFHWFQNFIRKEIHCHKIIIYTLQWHCLERLHLKICSVIAKVFLLSFQYFKKNTVSFYTYCLGSIMSRDMLFSCFQEFIFLYGEKEKDNDLKKNWSWQFKKWFRIITQNYANIFSWFY